MNITRRKILSHTTRGVTATALTGTLPTFSRSPLNAQLNTYITNSDLSKRLITLAIDSAISSGAVYADARITHTCSMSAPERWYRREESLEFGVRALFKGYWGYSSSPVLRVEEADRLGKDAVLHASVNAIAGDGSVELAPHSGFSSGTWNMPVEEDPFEMAPEEMFDFFYGLESFGKRLDHIRSVLTLARFIRQDKKFGSSLGQFTTQKIYRTSGEVGCSGNYNNGEQIQFSLNRYLTPAGIGFEYFRKQPLREYLEQGLEEAVREINMPVEPVDVGRYQTIIQSMGVASAISQSLGVAAEVDRAMGFESNAGGTSFISDPSAMVGELRIGSDMVTIQGNRSSPGSVGRVEWDDEGVEPREFTLIKNGVLNDMIASRDSVKWIKSDVKSNQNIPPHGCTYASTAIDVPLIYPPDLTLLSKEGVYESASEMRQEIDRGIEFVESGVRMDFQQSSGILLGSAFLINKGKRKSRVVCGLLFKTTELWNNVIAIGGIATSQRFGFSLEKGQPHQIGYHSVTSPPVLFKDCTIVDPGRKA